MYPYPNGKKDMVKATMIAEDTEQAKIPTEKRKVGRPKKGAGVTGDTASKKRKV